MSRRSAFGALLAVVTLAAATVVALFPAAEQARAAQVHALETTLTVGVSGAVSGYDVDGTTTTGSIGDASFTYRGTSYTITRLVEHNNNIELRTTPSISTDVLNDLSVKVDNKSYEGGWNGTTIKSRPDKGLALTSGKTVDVVIRGFDDTALDTTMTVGWDHNYYLRGYHDFAVDGGSMGDTDFWYAHLRLVIRKLLWNDASSNPFIELELCSRAADGMIAVDDLNKFTLVWDDTTYAGGWTKLRSITCDTHGTYKGAVFRQNAKGLDINAVKVFADDGFAAVKGVVYLPRKQKGIS